jgi:prepilin-type N-terminal cleavage/methylation domain-containing protein
MRGTTLVELMVVLLILGLIGGLTSLALGTLKSRAVSERARALGQARAAAIRSGKAVSVPDDSGEVIRFLPDGRAIGRGVDPLTGELSADR